MPSRPLLHSNRSDTTSLFIEQGDGMELLEAIRLAIAELGQEASADQITAFAKQRFGITIDPKFLPIYRACLRAKETGGAAKQQEVKSHPSPDGNRF